MYFIKTDAYETASAFTKSSFLWRLNGILVTPISANLLLNRSTLSILMMYDL
jgi:hypothetical protein